MLVETPTHILKSHKILADGKTEDHPGKKES
jgi:hypothetical protein